MKIQKYNAGALTNFEVLEFFKSRIPKSENDSKEFSRLMAPIAASEFKVYDYLVETAACNQTKENIEEFLKRCNLEHSFLSKAEILNIINIRPCTSALMYPVIEKVEARLGQDEYEERLEQLVEMVVKVLPEPPIKSNGQEVIAEEANAEEETVEEADAEEETAEEANAEEANGDEEIASEEEMEES